MTQAVADTLRRARALIDAPEKWCQGAYIRGASRCVMQALRNANDDFHAPHPAIVALSRAGGFQGRIFEWQDAPERTHAEIIAAFDAAIAAEEREP